MTTTTFIVDSPENDTRLNLVTLEAALDEVYSRRDRGESAMLTAVVERGGSAVSVGLLSYDDQWISREALAELVELQEDL